MRTPTVVNMKFGSHLYGLNTPTSDVDYKGIFMPTLEELLLNSFPKTIVTSTGPEHAKNGAGDVDTEFWDKWLLRVYAHEFSLNV